MAKIGPLPISAGEKHSAQYMEAVLTPGMTAPAHLHGGPEAWYTLAGETQYAADRAGDTRIFGHADSQADHLPLGSTPEVFRRNKTGLVAQYLRMECSF